jgi:hypothetical protein
MRKPQTVAQWAEYIGKLRGKTFDHKARAANSVMFVRTLIDEGVECDDVVRILVLFAGRYRELGMAVPTWFQGAYLSYADLMAEAKASDGRDAKDP